MSYKKKLIFLFIILVIVWIPLSLSGLFEVDPHGILDTLFSPLIVIMILFMPKNWNVLSKYFDSLTLPFIIFWISFITSAIILYVIHNKKFQKK